MVRLALDQPVFNWSQLSAAKLIYVIRLAQLSASRWTRVALGFILMIGLSAASHAQTPQTASAVFAGGCFWCMEPPYDKVDGVISTTPGYAGGEEKTATYEQVSSGTTGHYEAIKIEYDPAKVSYQQLLDIFWKNIDPFDAKGQFCDKGPQYRAAIFYDSEAEKDFAEASKKKVTEKLGKPVVTAILPAPKFYAAEDYHQDYYQNNPFRYKLYRYGCGRDKRLETVWGKQERSASDERGASLSVLSYVFAAFSNLLEPFK